MYLWRHCAANFKYQLPKKSDSMQKSHVTVRVVSHISRLPTVQALGWCIYRVWFRSPSRAYMSSEYKLLGNKELKKYITMILCVCSNRYTYTPHSCIIASVPLVPQCQARGCIPKRCGLSYVGGRCHIEKWTVDLYICPAVLLHASWRLHSRHVAVYIWFAEFNSQSARHLMFP